jgi:hypothetical protein
VHDLEIDGQRHKATRAGTPLNLAPKEFLLLAQLARSAGEVVSRTAIVSQLWDMEFQPTRMLSTSSCGACARRSTILSRRSWCIRFAGSAMSSSQAEPRAIASQLVLLFTVSAAVLFCCGIGVLYWIVVLHAFEEDDLGLRDRVAALRADLTRPSGARGLGEKLQVTRAGERVTYWVRVLDAEGRVVAMTPGMEAILPVDIFQRRRRPPPDSAPEASPYAGEALRSRSNTRALGRLSADAAGRAGSLG